MYNINIDKNVYSNIDKKIKEVKAIAKNLGYVNEKSLLYIFLGSDCELKNRDCEMGWFYNEVCESDFFTISGDEKTQNIVRYILSIPDPNPIQETAKPAEFDVVSHPSHYTEGRTYEPRKVIADWGLNFNLGNAVKYLSRAGRKGDKIEDLRKAIQYIQFEIEELGGGIGG